MVVFLLGRDVVLVLADVVPLLIEEVYSPCRSSPTKMQPMLVVTIYFEAVPLSVHIVGSVAGVEKWKRATIVVLLLLTLTDNMLSANGKVGARPRKVCYINMV